MPSQIIPGFRYRDAPRAIDWLCEAFGFERHMVIEGEGGRIDHAQLTYGDGMIMLGSGREDEYGALFATVADAGAPTSSAYVIVGDVDVHAARARRSGAEIISEPADQDYGGRLYTCRDLEGYVWNFGSYDPWSSPDHAS